MPTLTQYPRNCKWGRRIPLLVVAVLLLTQLCSGCQRSTHPPALLTEGSPSPAGSPATSATPASSPSPVKANASTKTPALLGVPPGKEYWEKAEREVDRSVLEILKQHRGDLERGLRYHIFFQGNPRKKEIALTFDDGPHPSYTLKLLEILKRYRIKATFFLVGKMAEKYPDLVKAEVEAGHSIGNHTYHHVNLTKIPEWKVATEIKACGEVLKAITGRAPHLFRPPGGDYSKRVTEDAEALGYIMVLWTDNSDDCVRPGKNVIEEITLDRIGNGGIILMHDGIQQTLDVLPRIIEYLRKRGYRFVTVDELMGRDAGEKSHESSD